MDECQLEKPVVVCLCGSTRFVEVFRYVNLRETLAGKIVLAPGCFQGDVVLEVLPGVKRRLNELHLRKIDLADVVKILDGVATKVRVRDVNWNTRERTTKLLNG